MPFADEEEKIIKEIRFPNTIFVNDQDSFVVNIDCDEIRDIWKSGEMAGVKWFQIIKNGKTIAEIKESVCNIFYKE